eukprot:536029-Alexandrium_andersonii.AAC.1
MSASLVGSEMCIRDRAAGGIPSPRGRRANPGQHVGSRRHAKPSGKAETVSYTHLTLPTICSV